jgi:hypothetical protein
VTTLALIAVFALGVLAKCLWDFLWDAFDRRQDRKYTARLARVRELTPELDATPVQNHRPVELIRTAVAPEGYSAAQILGYTDGGSRWHPPAFHSEAQTSAEALAAWDRRNDGTVA